MSIVQFGTSRFLQAHADLILAEAREKGQDVGPLTIVETTGSPASRARIAAFARGDAVPIRIRGLAGRQIDETRHVTGIADGLSAREDVEALRSAFLDARYVISNTGDRGFSLPDAPAPTLEGWSSYPELLTALLRERFQAHARRVTILPCELVTANGDILRDIVIELAMLGNGDSTFADWLGTHCLFMNSLVDRIVSEPIDPVGAVAEPYALWAIEAQEGFVPPCTHTDLMVVDDLGPIARKKLFILNLGHTLLAQLWRDKGASADTTVREFVADRQVFDWLDAIMIEEVLPAFPANDEAVSYWRRTCERFANPFLDHRLADIATNHQAKIERRAVGFLDWAGDAARDGCPMLKSALHLDEHI
jgi:tagaturonate reductase